jgi:hypothetical protein
MTGIDQITASASHEIVEAATDPFPDTQPAYIGVDDDHLAWSVAITGPGEVGDMCGSESSQLGRYIGYFLVQRSWSNQAAAANLDPCVPATSSPYFGAAPEFSDRVPFFFDPFKTPETLGARLVIGASTTIAVRLFSTGPSPNWQVIAMEVPAVPGSTPLGQVPNPTLEFGWDRSYGNNGDVLRLTITRKASGTGGGTSFLIFSGLEDQDSVWNTWSAFVAN